MLNGFDVGAFVQGAPTSARVLVQHDGLLNAYADDLLNDNREGYLSHFVFDETMQDHYSANRNSVKGFGGACCFRWLIFDIDRDNLDAALTDARNLALHLRDRYGIEQPPIYFSGSKGFHLLLELVHQPPASQQFPMIAKAFAEKLAADASVKIDASIYDIARIIRLPNTKHPRTGLFKSRVDLEDLLQLSVVGIRDHAKHPAGDGLPSCKTCPPRLAEDWQTAEQQATRTREHRQQIRQTASATPDRRAPRFFVELLRFGVGPGQRHQTLFRAAAWLREQNAPLALVQALLTEPGLDMGLTPAEVERQIRCGVEHADRQREATGGVPLDLAPEGDILTPYAACKMPVNLDLPDDVARVCENRNCPQHEGGTA